MKTAITWSLRLGFSNKQSISIEKLGIKKFLEQSFETKVDTSLPDCLKDSPKTLAQLKEVREKIKNATSEEQKKLLKSQIKDANDM